jgi:subtilase family serine protease
MARVATAVSTPGDPAYGDYLSVGQFARRFGAPAAHIAAVRSALQKAGLQVGLAPANHLTLPVTGTVAHVETALSVVESQVRLPRGRVAYANDRAPRLPATIAHYVQGVVGLSNITSARPLGIDRKRIAADSSDHRARTITPRARPRVNTGGPIPCTAASQAVTIPPTGSGIPVETGYTADEIAGAYNFTGFYQAGDQGAGQTIALAEFDAYQPSDIAAYQACYGTSTSVTPINVDGGPAPYPGDGGDGEPALDIEQVAGLATRANVLVYQGPNNAAGLLAVYNRIVSDNQAKIISNSYGLCESQRLQLDPTLVYDENRILQEAAMQGQSFFSASGDAGAEDCYTQSAPDYTLAVDDPASQQFATSVGGTSLGSGASPSTWVRPDNGTYPGETVWNDGATANGTQPISNGASGGGDSQIWAMPAYQSSSAPTLGVLNSEKSQACASQFCREVPDVSADADYNNSGYAIYADNGWSVNGGTSAAAPFWAAFTALANAYPSCRGLTLGFLNPILYQVASNSYNSNFHDVDSGSAFTAATDYTNNPFYAYTLAYNPNDYYDVFEQYDQTTGLGTPIGSALGPSLCAVRSPVYTVAVASPGTLTTSVGQGVALQIHASDSGGAGLSYSASGLPAGLSINPANGVISGTPTTPQSTVATIAATDGYNNSGSTQFTWTIKSVPKPVPVSRPRATSVRLGGLGQRRPKLSFEVRAGANAPSLKSVSISVPKGLSFVRSKGPLVRGLFVKVNGHRSRFAATIRNTPNVANGRLTITFTTSLRDARLTIQKPAMIVSSRLAHKIKRHLIRKVVIQLKLIDTSRRATASKITLRKLS